MPTPDLLRRITTDPAVCHGQPCVGGLRYPVALLLELMSSGMSHEEILADYEDLEREDLLAALAYASRLADVRRVALIADYQAAVERRLADRGDASRWLTLGRFERRLDSI